MDDQHYKNYKRTYFDWLAFSERDGAKIHLWNLLNGLLRAHYQDIHAGGYNRYAVGSFDDLCIALKLPSPDNDIILEATSRNPSVTWETWLGAQIAQVEEAVPLVTGDNDVRYEVPIGLGVEVDEPVAFIKYGRKIHDKEWMLENSATNLIGYFTGDREKIEAYPDPTFSEPASGVRDGNMEPPPFRETLIDAVDEHDFEAAFDSLGYEDRVKLASILTSGLSASDAGKQFLKTQLQESYADGGNPVFDIKRLVQPPDAPDFFEAAGEGVRTFKLPSAGAPAGQAGFVNHFASLVLNVKPGALQLYDDEGDISTAGEFFIDASYAFQQFYGVPKVVGWLEYSSLTRVELDTIKSELESGSRDTKARELASLGRKLSLRAGADFEDMRGVATPVSLVFSGIGLASAAIGRSEGVTTAREVMNVTDSLALVADGIAKHTRSFEQRILDNLLGDVPAHELSTTDFFEKKSAFRFASDLLGPIMDLMDLAMSIEGLHQDQEVGDTDAAVAHTVGIVGSGTSLLGGMLGLAGMGLTAGLLLGFGSVIGIIAAVALLVSENSPLQNWAMNTYFGYHYWEADADLFDSPSNRYYRFKVDGEPKFARQVSEFYTMMNPVSLWEPLIAIQEDSGDHYYTLRIDFGYGDAADEERFSELMDSGSIDPAEGLDRNSWIQVRPIIDPPGTDSYPGEPQHAVRLDMNEGARDSNWKYRYIKCQSFGAATRVSSPADTYWSGYFNGTTRRSDPPTEGVLGLREADRVDAVATSGVGAGGGPFPLRHGLELVLMTPGQFLTWHNSRDEPGFDTEEMPDVRRERNTMYVKDWATRTAFEP